MIIRPARLLLLSALALSPVLAQSGWDNSGNSMLNGTYYFRQVIYILNSSTGSLTDAGCFYGNVTFNGSGSYTMSNTQLVDLAAQSVTAPNPTGTYAVAASGQVVMTNPLFSKDNIIGLVNQQGILVGAATENTSLYNDLFIAAPLPSPLSNSTSSFRGPYSMAYLDMAQGLGALAQMNPDGSGNMGTVAVSGYVEGGGTNKISQNLTGAKYVVVNGAAKITFTTNNNAFFSGPTPYYLYFSPDGNFVFGGGQFSADMFVGVKTGTGTPTLGGLYYEAGLDDSPESFYGSFSATNGAIIGHQRLLNFFNSTPSISFSYSDSYSLGTGGAYSNGLANYVVGGDNIRIGSGIGPNLSLAVSLPAPTLDPTKISPSGVYLNPTGIVNAGSSAPFTAAISPGELLTIYGANMSAGTQVASAIPFPTTLGNTQVKINGTLAPLYYVTPGQLSAIVPYSVTSGVAQVQVINNGTASNVVTMMVAPTAPGILTQSQNGLGYGDAVHPDGTLVNGQNPAKAGETVSVFLTGLGSVTPPISDGAAGPTSPYSITTNTITSFINGTSAPVGYAGLAPTLAGLYQLNITIPSGLTAGDAALDVSAPDSYTSVCLIAVSGGSTAEPASEATPAMSKLRSRPMQGRHLTPLTNRVIR
jgi:uncharacterized protein (TIGR03437 family)